MKSSVFVCFLGCVMPLTTMAAAAPDIVPAVRSWTPTSGSLTLTSNDIKVPAAHAQALRAVVDITRVELETIRPPVNKSAKSHPAPQIELTLDGGDAARPEGYTLTIGEGVRIAGATPAGVYYGTRSLLQMLRQSPVLPKGVISDYPAYRGRMLMLDVGRKPYPLPVLKDFIRMMAWYKMNELHLHLSDEAFGGDYAAFRVESKTFPGLAAKDLFYTKADLRDLQDFAKARGITITPEIDMPGHARCFTNYWPEITLTGQPNYMDVTQPKTIEVMKELLDEMIPLFDAPDFHIGTDEYRVGGPRKAELHESFRKFINTMNAHIRSRGKNCRIWSGFEHMGGTTEIDPTVIIDMWETDDAKGQIAKGHSIINSNHGRTYIVPGCHYYGISRGGIYEGWEPWMVSGNMAKNPAKEDPKLLGGKLHVWFDQGPTGYTLTETADTTLTGIHPFAEKLWGTKGSANYKDFTARVAKTLPIPEVKILERLPIDPKGNGVVLNHPGEVTLKDEQAWVPLPWAKEARADLEYPWTLTMEVYRAGDSAGRGVLLSSELAEICANFSKAEKRKVTGDDGKAKEETVTLRGIGTLRAAGSRQGKGSAAETRTVDDVSKSSGVELPLKQWATITIVGEQGRNTMWLNGVKIGESGNQLVCPLRGFGSQTGQSFVGKLRKIRVVGRALSAKEIARAAGLDVPDNLATGAAVSASASDTGYGLVPGNVTDADPSSRWSSGATHAEQWLAIDLGKVQAFNQVNTTWENAVPKQYRIQVSKNGRDWSDVFTGNASPGKTTAQFAPQRARHLRLVMSQPQTAWGYSIHDIEVMAVRRNPQR